MHYGVFSSDLSDAHLVADRTWKTWGVGCSEGEGGGVGNSV